MTEVNPQELRQTIGAGVLPVLDIFDDEGEFLSWLAPLIEDLEDLYEYLRAREVPDPAIGQFLVGLVLGPIIGERS